MFNRRLGLLGLAIAMLAGSAGPSMNAQNQIASGAAIMHGLRNKYRETARYPGKRSGVAAAKRRCRSEAGQGQASQYRQASELQQGR